MNQYKSKDFLKRQPQEDTVLWFSKDLKFTISTGTNPHSKYFVYVNLGTDDEWVGISEDTLDDAIQSLNKMIESEEINKYLI